MWHLLRYLTLILLLVTIVWLVRDPGWNPLVTFLTALIAFVGLYHKVNQVRKPDETEVPDKCLFDALRKNLSFEGKTHFLKTHDFGGEFKSCELDKIKEFEHNWVGPEHEFIDQELEAKKKKLHEKVSSFMNAIRKYTFTEGNGWQRIPKEWRFEKEKQYEYAENLLNSSAEAVVNLQEDLFQTARKKLKV